MRWVSYRELCHGHARSCIARGMHKRGEELQRTLIMIWLASAHLATVFGPHTRVIACCRSTSPTQRVQGVVLVNSTGLACA